MSASIIVHGGAGSLGPPGDSAAATHGCLAAARRGHAAMRAGGTAVDAVVAAVICLEDDPRYNAGTGAVLNVDGEVELDAAVMDGAGGRAGAVALVRTIKNPVVLARLVMERTAHVLLAAEGAEAFAREQGIPAVDPRSLTTAEQRLKWQRAGVTSHGTVGAVAFDGAHLAAATSTGGTSHKLHGRIGDSPLIGCGTYALDGAGAISCTGLGEAIIRAVLGKSVVDLLAAGQPPAAAALQGLALLKAMNGEGGVILVDGQGHLAAAFSTERMAHAWIDLEGNEGSAA
jgi:beta-aspartyl-peptidase (threonine type)